MKDRPVKQTRIWRSGLDVIYVLHCFEKDTNRTSRQDLDTARTRLKEVLAEIREKKAQLKKETRHGSH
jgi:hypothetical protein